MMSIWRACFLLILCRDDLLSSSTSIEDIKTQEFQDIPTDPPDIQFIKEYMTKVDAVTLSSGLRYRILKTGSDEGKSPTVNTPCEVLYIGKTVDGEVFDGSDKNQGDITVLYPSKVIRGLREALLLMKEGDKWEVVIPSHLGYGKMKSKNNKIRPGSTLIFEIELLRVRAPEITYFKKEYLAWIFLIAFLIYNYFQSQARVDAVRRSTPVDVESVSNLPNNPIVYMTIAVDDVILGKIEMELFPTVCPKTVENFRCLCTGEKGMCRGAGLPLHFNKSKFHRIIPGFMCQGGRSVLLLLFPFDLLLYFFCMNITHMCLNVTTHNMSIFTPINR
jgi:hypothetical protein